MEYIPTHVLEPLRQQLIDYCYPYIACMIAVHKDLGRGMPEYLYQEALKICFEEQGYKTHKEYEHHPIFHGKTMSWNARPSRILLTWSNTSSLAIFVARDSLSASS